MLFLVLLAGLVAYDMGVVGPGGVNVDAVKGTHPHVICTKVPDALGPHPVCKKQ